MSARELVRVAAVAALLCSPPAWAQGKKGPAAHKRKAQAPASQPASAPARRRGPGKGTARAPAPRKRLSKKDLEVIRNLELLQNLKLLEAMDLLADTRKKGRRKK